MNIVISGSRFFILIILGLLIGSVGASASSTTSQNMTKGQMPKGLWQAFSETRHAVEPNKEKKENYIYKAYNPKNRYGIRYGEQGLKLLSRDWEFVMSLHSYGQESALVPVNKATLHTEGNKVSYNRGSISEWYINDTQGLEQGFTLDKPKNYDARQELILTFELKGELTPKWKIKGESLSFYKNNIKAFDYEKLKAFDAKGKALHSRLALKENSLQILVNAKDAQWPVTVDPIFSTEQKVVGVKSDATYTWFGHSVALSGDTALIGTPQDDDNGTDSGSAYIFTRSGNTWSLETKLTASDATTEDQFGYSVALDGDTALVGAYGDDDGSINSGAVYIFTRSGTTWEQQTKLIASDATANDQFGYSVALDGDAALIGADVGVDYKIGGSGSAYIFTRSGTTWTEQQKLTASDAEAGDQFGRSVALEGDTALIGAWLDDDVNSTESGSAYIFTRSGTTWTEQQRLTASDAADGDRFGYSVALNGDTALVGAYWDDDDIIGKYTGSAYIFTRSGTTWTEQQRLTASDAAEYDNFGRSVALKGNMALIGSPYDDDIYSGSGSAYIFTRSGMTWREQQKLTASDAAAGDLFGNAVAFDGDTALIGAFSSNDNGTSSGSAYFNRFECGFSGPIFANTWTMIGLPCAPDSNADTVGELFGDTLNVSEYYARWIVHRYNAANNTYEQLQLTDTVSQGEGYWLLSYDDSYWDATGSLTSYPVTQSEGCAVAEGCYAIDLVLPDSATTRYNMVGFPNNIDIDWSQARFLVNNTISYTPSEAETNSIASKMIWKWNGSSYDTYDDSTPGMLGTLSSHEGFWVQMLSGSFGETSVQLLIPAK